MPKKKSKKRRSKQQIDKAIKQSYVKEKRTKEHTDGFDPSPSSTLLVYTGVFKECERIGKKTGVKYIFTKDEYGMPKPLNVYNKDKKYLLAERGKGCARRMPKKVFMTLTDWNAELEEQRKVNKRN